MTKAQKTTAAHTGEDGGEEAANDVRLVGRLTGAPAVVELPSGDALVTFRISVRRSSPPGSHAGGRAAGQRVDSVPCAAWSPRLRRSILTWRPGDLVEVEASSARIIRRSSAA